MPRASPLPAGIPRLLARRPHLIAAWLRWRNAYRCKRARVLGGAALVVALAVGMAAAAPTGGLLQRLAASPAVTFALSACLFGLSAVHRQARLRGEAATSWLAALPVAGSGRLRLALGLIVGLLAAVCFVGVAWAAGRITEPTASLLVLLTTAGALVGSLAGWRLQGRAAAGAPGWHYAMVRRARRRWATAPSLAPLSYWPVAQARIFSRPRTTSVVVLIVLLAIPSGSHDVPGQVAIAVAAGSITFFTLLALSAAAVRVAGDAARWLAPTTIRLRSFIAAYVWRVVLEQAAVLGVVIFLACAVDYPHALRAGMALSCTYLATSCAAASGACVWACRRVGLGTASRGC